MKQVPISVCMIGKNEERFLEKTLDALRGFLEKMPKGSELVFADTGSSDHTREIAARYTDRIYDFAWCDDFSAARNFAASKAGNDLIFALDCDEVPVEYDAQEFCRLTAEYSDCLGDIVRQDWSPESDGSASLVTTDIRRIYDRRLYRFRGIIHEQIIPILPRKLYFYKLPILLDHQGYMGSLEERRKKSERNASLLRQIIEKEPEEPYHYLQLGQSYHALDEWEEAVVWYEKACSFPLTPDLPYVGTLLLNYGYDLLSLGREEEALKLLEKYYPDFFLSSDLFCLAGAIRQHTGEPIKAMLEYMNAILCPVHYKEGTNSFIPYFQIGVIYEILGKREEALDNYRKCGDFPPALDCIRNLTQ